MDLVGVDEKLVAAFAADGVACDAIFFDFLTVHGAPGFPFEGRRRVLSLRYLSAGARHAPRKWRTSPQFEGLDRELAAGAALDHPLFPVVWPGN
jgi:hypothetical protein